LIVPFRLVASDLDGTLLHADDAVSDHTRKVLHALPDHVEFVIATGRPPRWTWDIADAIGLGGLAVCSNGAVTINVHDRSIVATHFMNDNDALAVVAAVRSVLPDAHFAVDTLHGFRHEPLYTSMFVLPDELKIAPVHELLDGTTLKLLFRHSELTNEMLLRVIDAIGDRGTVTFGSSGTVTGRTLIEIMAPGVSKATALQQVCELRALTNSDVIAFGDMPNDLEMLQWAGHGVAMANGHEDVLAIANEIAPAHSEDGVAQVLTRLYKLG
jgi:Cof subfamily protein (haloacid dehalogenase superfamily)